MVKTGDKKKMKTARSKAKKLSTRIALITSVMLIIIFTTLITVTTITTKSAIGNSSFGELRMLSGKNATDIQQIMNRAESTSADVSAYLQNAGTNIRKLKSLQVDRAAQELAYRSQVYPALEFKTSDMRIEDYLISTLQAAVMNSEDIIGAAVLFEPRFIANQENYSIYVGDDGVASNFGLYADYSKEAYYKEAFEQKQVVYTDPYEFENTKIVTVSAPVTSNGAVIAVVTVNMDIHQFDKISSVNAQYPSMYTAILKDNGIIIYESSGLDYVGTNTFEYMDNPKYIDETKTGMASHEAFYTTSVNSTSDKVYKFYDPIHTGSSYWYSMTAVNVADVNRTANRTSMLLLIISALALVIILLVLVSILKKTLNPINNVVAVANRIAEGDLSVSIEAVSDDEIGALARAFQRTISSLNSMISGVTHTLEEIADNNLSISMDTEFKGDFSKIGIALNRILANLNDVLGKINVAGDEVSSGSEQVSCGAQALSQGTTEQASSVEELAATISEISSQVNDNAISALEASDKTNQVSTQILTSNQQMQNMISAMHEISDSSSQIGKIIKTIEDIAFQTNILALNAAVEAARAGTAGKGFAVVADEVRNLASKSAAAAKNTTALIEGSKESVEHGTKIADETAQSLSLVVESAQQVSNIVDRISVACKSQADALTQVTVGIDQVSAVVQTNSATAEQSAAASEELSSQAQLLRDLISRFRLFR